MIFRYVYRCVRNLNTSGASCRPGVFFLRFVVHDYGDKYLETLDRKTSLQDTRVPPYGPSLRVRSGDLCRAHSYRGRKERLERGKTTHARRKGVCTYLVF